MDYTQAFAISAAGMSVERMRVDVAALNLANADTIQTGDGVSYRPLRVVARSTNSAGGARAFAAQVDQGLADTGLAAIGLPSADVEPQAVEPRKVYEPGHPFANKQGFVSYPGVDPATEMMSLTSALRAYEANVVAMNTARTLALKALEIGGT